MSDHVYKLKYKLETEYGDFSGAAAKALHEADASGFTDALVLISILRGEDGGYSQQQAGMDGATQMPLKPGALFKVWLVMGMGLARSAGLDEARRTFARMVVDSFMEAAGQLGQHGQSEDA